MTKDDLPPLPEHWMPLNLVGLDVNLWKPAIDRYAEAYARAAIAAHDAKRERMLFINTDSGLVEATLDQYKRPSTVNGVWAYIEREGA